MNNAAVNLGDLVNDFPGDDGENIFYDNGLDGLTWHIWNASSSPVNAHNNYWPDLVPEAIDATLWDDEEGGSEVIFEPIYVAALPLPPDLNDDGNLNILDVVLVIENTLPTGLPAPLQFYLADSNRDYEINVADVVTVIEQVVGR